MKTAESHEMPLFLMPGECTFFYPRLHSKSLKSAFALPQGGTSPRCYVHVPQFGVSMEPRFGFPFSKRRFEMAFLWLCVLLFFAGSRGCWVAWFHIFHTHMALSYSNLAYTTNAQQCDGVLVFKTKHKPALKTSGRPFLLSRSSY
jgi:hypothetical protein